jgi:hypothetical protein
VSNKNLFEVYVEECCQVTVLDLPMKNRPFLFGWSSFLGLEYELVPACGFLFQYAGSFGTWVSNLQPALTFLNYIYIVKITQ